MPKLSLMPAAVYCRDSKDGVVVLVVDVGGESVGVVVLGALIRD